MIWKYIHKNFFTPNYDLVLKYIIICLVLYPIEAIGLSRLYSNLISKAKDIKRIKVKNLEFRNIDLKNPSIEIIILLIGFSILLLTTIDNFKNKLYSNIFPKFKEWIRMELFEKTLHKYSNNFKDLNIGLELLRMEDLVIITTQQFLKVTSNFFPIILISLILMIYLFYVNINLGLIIFIYLTLSIIVLILSYKKIFISVTKRFNSYYKMIDEMDNSYTNLSNILVNNKTNHEINKNNNESIKYKSESKNTYLLIKNTVIILRIILVLFILSVLLYSYKLLKTKYYDIEQFITIIVIIIYFGGLILNNLYNLVLITEYQCQLDYFSDYLMEIFLKNNNKNSIKKNITNWKIEFKNLYFKYEKSNKHVLKNLNFKIEPKQKIAILGKSGSGKSTLMKILIKFFKPSMGKVLIGNTNIEDINTEYLRENITYINQNTLLFDEDIYYNIKYGMDNISTITSSNKLNLDNIKIKKILKKYDLLTIYDKLENKLRTKAGPRGTNLSLGMQKVTIIMRGILKKSKVIIFDEPLAGLDQLTRQKIINLILNETKDKTVIIITHDKEILPYMDKVINLQEINNN